VPLALLLITGACAQLAPADQERMLSACRFRACVCVDENARPSRPGPITPVVWAQNGDPTCPQGKALTYAHHESYIFRDQDRITQPDPLRNERDTGPN